MKKEEKRRNEWGVEGREWAREKEREWVGGCGCGRAKEEDTVESEANVIPRFMNCIPIPC